MRWYFLLESNNVVCGSWQNCISFTNWTNFTRLLCEIIIVAYLHSTWQKLVTEILYALPIYLLTLPPRQHPSYGDCLEFKREYYQNSSVLECVTQC